MKVLRFSLKGMLAIVAFVAFACIALLNATAVWACVAFTGTVMVLLIAAVGVVYSEAERQVFYVGASLFGWMYLLLSFAPGFIESTRPHLLTLPLLNLLYRHVEREAELPEDIRATHTDLGISGSHFVLPRDTVDNTQAWAGAQVTKSGCAGPDLYRFPIAKHFHTVGHSLFALLFATAGGLVARFFCRTKDRSTDTTT